MKFARMLVFCLLLLFGQVAFAFECNTHIYYGVTGDVDQNLCRTGYAVGYNHNRKVPDWVAYRLTKLSVDIDVPRTDEYLEDHDVILYHRALLEDYVGSGYDRGHLAPAASVGFNQESMQQSFLLTNIAPQLPEFNRGIWRKLEAMVRNWARARGDIFVVTGPIWDDERNWIGEHVGVPAAFYKVIYDPYRNEMAAFVLPHEELSPDAIWDFQTSVDVVEQLTGFDFFSNVDDEDEIILEESIEESWKNKREKK